VYAFNIDGVAPAIRKNAPIVGACLVVVGGKDKQAESLAKRSATQRQHKQAHSKLETLGTTRLAHSRCVRHSDSTSTCGRCEVPSPSQTDEENPMRIIFEQIGKADGAVADQ
jgi:hypothetical protein